MAEISIRMDGALLGKLNQDLRIADSTNALASNSDQPNSARRAYHCRFVRAGETRAAGGGKSLLEILPEALEKAVAKRLFDACAVFVDHPGMQSGTYSSAPVYAAPSLDNLVGVTSNSTWNAEDQCVEGIVRFYSNAESVTVLLDEMLQEGSQAPDVGLSIVFWPVFARRTGRRNPGQPDTRLIVGIKYVESVDLVFEPAADGRVLQALSTNRVRNQAPDKENSTGGVLMDDIEKSFDWHAGRIAGPDEGEDDVGDREPLPAAPRAADAGQSTQHSSASLSGHSPSSVSLAGQGKQVLEELLHVTREHLVNTSGLPEASKQRLLEGSYATPQEVSDAIQHERQYLGKLAADRVVQLGGQAPRAGHIQVGLDGLERLSLALDALLAGKGPASGIVPLSGIREAYILLSGDYDMTGVFHPERIGLANVNSSTMAGLVANALNKAVVNDFQQYPRWWEPIVVSEDFTNLQQVKWITLGGVGELPTVAEGAATPS